MSSMTGQGWVSTCPARPAGAGAEEQAPLHTPGEGSLEASLTQCLGAQQQRGHSALGHLDFIQKGSILVLCAGSQTAAGTQGWLCFHRAFLIQTKATESMDSGESSSEQLSLASAFPLKIAYFCPGSEKSWLAQSFPIEK